MFFTRLKPIKLFINSYFIKKFLNKLYLIHLNINGQKKPGIISKT